MRTFLRDTLRQAASRRKETSVRDGAHADEGEAEADGCPSTVARKRCEGDSYLCDVCLDTFELRRSNIVDQDGWDGIQMRHHQNLDRFKNAAGDGCWFCERLWHRWEALELSDNADGPNVLARLYGVGEGDVVVQFNCGPLLPSMDFKMPTVRADERVVPIPGRPLPTFSDGTFAQARRWIDDCISNHHLCNPKRSVAWHPTRLLELDAPTGQVRLIETKDNPVAGPYITLSHRWARDFDSSLILRDRTRQQFQRGVVISHLPRLVQDAAAICSRFSIRYLWVDCMCIIQDQDDSLDWRTQSLSMEDVYSCSYINLSAVASANTESSLFQSTLAQVGEGRLTTRLKSNDNNGNLRRGWRQVQHRIPEVELWQVEIDEAPLNRRAWVLQERLLASRTLHIGSGRLFWECCEQVAADGYPGGLPGHIHCDSDFKKRLHFSQPEHMSSDEQCQVWSRIVEYYSKCDLTKGSDKLIALSGLAKRAKRLFQDEYTAGMWRSTLELELFWHARLDWHSQKRFQKSTRGQSYRAPSFSWASVDAEIDMSPIRENDQEILRVQGVQLTLDSTDECGAVQGGYLELRCILQKFFYRGPLNIFDAILRINGRDMLRLEESRELIPIYSSIYLDDRFEHFDPQGKDDLFCVPDGSSDDPKSVKHLLLHLVDAKQGIFKRFGLADTRLYYIGGEADGTRLRCDCPPEAANYPCISFDSEKKRHLIRII